MGLFHTIYVCEEVEQGLILMPGVVTNAAAKQANQSLTKVVGWCNICLHANVRDVCLPLEVLPHAFHESRSCSRLNKILPNGC